MIARLIAASARNLMLVLIGTAFAVAAGVYAVLHLPLDAIPDLSDTQVIVYTEYPGQAPQVVEDQVTYPLTTAMLTVPRSRVVRGFSYFGVSFVYVIFEDGTDIYWARSRVLEYLNAATQRLPGGVTPTLGPDATGVGWVYQYALHRQGPVARRAAVAAGLVRALRPRQGRGGRRNRQRRRLRQAIQRGDRPAAAAQLRYPALQGPRCHPRQQHGCGRAHRRTLRIRIRGARARLSQGHPRPAEDRSQERRRHAGSHSGRGAGRARTGRTQGPHRTQRRWRGRQRHRAAALRRQRARCHRQCQKAHRRDRGQPAQGRGSRGGLRPLDAHSRGDRDAAPHAARGKRHRRPGVRRLPAACAQRPGGDPHAAGRRADGLRRHEGTGPRLQHHEPRRHRDRHRRHGRCGDRHDRERAQASRTRRHRASHGWRF